MTSYKTIENYLSGLNIELNIKLTDGINVDIYIINYCYVCQCFINNIERIPFTKLPDFLQINNIKKYINIHDTCLEKLEIILTPKK
jgi:hypothetical protein